jgi:hypothetical protein
VLSVFSPLHYDQNPEESPKKTCFQCHSNHAIKDTGEWLYEQGYTEAADPRTKPFLAARAAFADLSSELSAAETLGASLGKRGYPTESLKEAIGAARRKLAESRPLVHALDEERLANQSAAIRADLDAARSEAEMPLHARDERWKLVAGVWAGAIALNLLIWRRLRAMPKAARGVPGSAAPGA